MLIKDICSSITDGSHNPPQGIDTSSYLMLSSKNIFDDEITLDQPRFLSKEDFENENKRTKVKCGDVLLTIVGTVGRAAVVPNNLPSFTLQRSVAVLHPDEDVCSGRYLMYALRGKRSYIESHSKGVAQKGIYLKEVSGIDLPVPSKEVQEQIIEKLDKMNSIIKSRQLELEKLDELIKARFVELFGDPVQNPYGWSTRPFLEMGYCKNGMNFHIGDNGVKMHCLGVGDFKDYAVIDGTNHLSIVSLNETPPEESMLQDGDIVFVRSNGNKALVGRCLVVYPHSTPTTYSGFCIRYRLTSAEVDIIYLLYVLKTDSMRKKMEGRGANIQNLNQQILATMDIPTPPMDLQKQFTDFVSKTAKSKVAVQKALDETQLLFDSLMQKYFG